MPVPKHPHLRPLKCIGGPPSSRAVLKVGALAFTEDSALSMRLDPAKNKAVRHVCADNCADNNNRGRSGRRPAEGPRLRSLMTFFPHATYAGNEEKADSSKIALFFIVSELMIGI